MTLDAATRSQYLADDPPTIVPLKIQTHFAALTDKEKKQVSPESENIYDFIIRVHQDCGGDYAALKQKAGVSEGTITQYLNYASMFLGNAGNYKSFGDSKFIPRVEAKQLDAIATASPSAQKYYQRCKDAFYETKSVGQMHLGYPESGHISAYYPDSPDIKTQEIEYIADFLKDRNLLPENTRLKKDSGLYECLIASATTNPSEQERDITTTEFDLEGPLKGSKLRLVYGDSKVEMDKIALALREAQKYAANEHQERMQAQYVKSFHSGSQQAFLQSQRHWIRDKGPSVESNIGFIESYRDPHGIRAEWEGFAACVNKERTRVFGSLVEAAPSLIPSLPWGPEFEKDKFLSPDFTSLEVLTFAGSGIPAGINIPNADEIRQTEGFKNVSLGNVLSAKPPDEKIPFIRDEDMEVFKRCSNEAFEVQVGLHELLGHGCGKLLQETEKGKFNFDKANPPTNPITGKAVESWYKPGETWNSVFGGMGPSYEECRAECVAMVLCCDYSILKIFGIGNGQEDIHGPAGDVLFAAYLSMARAGVASLQFWDASARKWGQAHMQARHAILKVFLSAGPEFCSLQHDTGPDGALTNLEIHIDRTKIASHGRPAVAAFLQKLQVYKATADLKAGKELYEGITNVDDWFREKVRPEVLRRAQPRKVFVQANTIDEGGSVTIKEYPATPEGMIQSYAERTYV